MRGHPSEMNHLGRDVRPCLNESEKKDVQNAKNMLEYAGI